MDEAGDAAAKLKAALSARGITSFVSSMDSRSNSIADDIAVALCECKVFVVLGTKTFGKKTDIGFSTYNELVLACDRGKPMFLIKTFDGDFTEPTTLLRLPKDMPFTPWDPATPADEVVGIICRMVE
jgi:hypothetical protein